MGLIKLTTTCSLAACLLFIAPQSSAQTPSSSGFKSGHPDKHVVQKGDTLWDIASKFLDSPWHWEALWMNNPAIENPHLIFPGDLLIVTSDKKIKAVRTTQTTEAAQTTAPETGKTMQITLKTQPVAHATPFERAIPTISPNVIGPFLSSSMIIDPGALDHLGYVLSGVGDELILGGLSKFYARGLSDQSVNEYAVFRAGETLVHPETEELLGVEAIHVGHARIDTWGEDVSKLIVTSSNREIQPTDRLLPKTGEMPLPYFQPRAPDSDISGLIIHSPNGLFEVGKYDVVVITGGARDGIKSGHVFKTLIRQDERIDPVTGENYSVPDEQSGLIMAFRVFDKVSYVLVMESVRAISLGDEYVSP